MRKLHFKTTRTRTVFVNHLLKTKKEFKVLNKQEIQVRFIKRN